MKYFNSIFFLFLFLKCNAQDYKEEDAYLYESYNIYDVATYELLLSYKNEFDSIQLLEVFQGYHNPKKSGGYSLGIIYPLDSAKINRNIKEIRSSHTKEDTIIFSHRENLLYSVYPSTELNFAFPKEYTIKKTRKQKRISVIDTKNVKAKFSYDGNNRLLSIKFTYPKMKEISFAEGTLSQIKFNYKKGLLFSLELVGFYGSDLNIMKYFKQGSSASNLMEDTFQKEKYEFDCHIKYLDAVFYQKPTDCNSPKPISITSDSITSYSYGDLDLLNVISSLDSITGRKTKFEFSLGTFGAHLVNYSDELYETERAAWITEFEKKKQ